MRRNTFQTKLSAVALVAIGLMATAAQAQTTHTVGSTGTFPDITTAIAAPAVIDGDILLLDPANNGGGSFAPGNITKGVIVRGQNGAQVVGANWVMNSPSSPVRLESLSVTGATGNNGVVINSGTDVTLDSVTISNKPNFGVNVNEGTINIVNGSQIINNGGAGVSFGFAGPCTANITGTVGTPIVISGNGTTQVAALQRANLSSRANPGSHAAVWNLENVNLVGADYGYLNSDLNTNVETLDFANVNISGATQNGILVAGQNTTIDYVGGTIIGRAAAPVDVIEEINVHPIIWITGASSNNTFAGTSLNFPGGDYGTRIRNDSNPMTIFNSTLNGGLGGLSVIYAGGGGVQFTESQFSSSAAAIVQGVGGTAPITFTDPSFVGLGAPIMFFTIGHTGEFTIEGTDDLNKVSVDTTGTQVVIRTGSGTTNLTNVQSTAATSSLIDTFGFGPSFGPITVNIDKSTFLGAAGVVTFYFTDGVSNVASVHPVTLNATNSIWRGTSPAPWVLSSNDPLRAAQGNFNITHSTIAPSGTAGGGLLINTNAGDVINGQYSIFDASNTATLLASGSPLTGTQNVIYSTGGATGNGGWVGGFPGDSIIADPQLAANGELTASSPAVDAATTSTIADDYVGTARPLGLARDIGAHESGFSTVEGWTTY